MRLTALFTAIVAYLLFTDPVMAEYITIMIINNKTSGMVNFCDRHDAYTDVGRSANCHRVGRP